MPALWSCAGSARGTARHCDFDRKAAGSPPRRACTRGSPSGPCPNRRPLVLDGYVSPFGRPSHSAPTVAGSRRAGRNRTPCCGSGLCPAACRPRHSSSECPGARTRSGGRSLRPARPVLVRRRKRGSGLDRPLDGSAPQKLPAFSSDTLVDAAAVSPSGRSRGLGVHLRQRPEDAPRWDTEMSAIENLRSTCCAAPMPWLHSPRTAFVDGSSPCGFSDEKTLYSLEQRRAAPLDPRYRLHGAWCWPRRRTWLWRWDRAVVCDSSSSPMPALATPAAGFALFDFQASTSRPLSQFGCVVAAVGTRFHRQHRRRSRRPGRSSASAASTVASRICSWDTPGLLSAVAISPDWSLGRQQWRGPYAALLADAGPLQAAAARAAREQLLAKLRTLTNLRAVRDASSPPAGRSSSAPSRAGKTSRPGEMTH